MMWFETLNSAALFVYLVDQKSFFLFTPFFSTYLFVSVVLVLWRLSCFCFANACVRAVCTFPTPMMGDTRNIAMHICRWVSFFFVVYTI